MKTYLKSIIIFSICFFLGVKVSYASSSLFLTKSFSTVSVGDKITLEVKVKSKDQAINAVSGSVIFPADMLKMLSVSRDNSILNVWTRDPSVQRNKISFEGVILNPGYQGNSGNIFRVTFEARKPGEVTVSFGDGSVLANDGLGTNILGALDSTSFNIIGTGALDLVGRPIVKVETTSNRLQALPIITDYSASVLSKDSIFLKGRGEPNALTKLSFEDVSHKSFGEQFMDFIQSKKKRLSDVLVKNNDKGSFEYVTPNNLVAGVYNATPFLVDNNTNTNKPGLGVQLFVSDSKIIKWLVIFINILILLIPIVGLIMIVYFIPWYSARRMRILKRKMGLEEEKIEITAHELERQDKLSSLGMLQHVDTEKKE